ncbi:MAG: E3 binding domain-containing protein, partial [Flavobacteriales bacterium]|nr:E3 binding domain-containing protein [Flavobacteriales bacterium]
MAEIVRMPKLSDTMTEGVVAEWHKKVGDNIESGELLAEIETDKATMEFESFQEGVLLHIGVEKGQTAPVDSILAILGEKGEDVAKLLKEEKASETESVEKEDSKPIPTPNPIPAEIKPQPSVNAAPSVPTPSASSNNSFPSLDSLNSLETKASPLAKKLAEERGINLKFVSGTGTDGRIVKRDIDNFQGSATVQGQEAFVDEPVSQM